MSGVSGSGGGGTAMAAPWSRVVAMQYPMLNDTNYGVWAVKMKIILRNLGVWAAVMGEAVAEEEKDNEALVAISQAIRYFFAVAGSYIFESHETFRHRCTRTLVEVEAGQRMRWVI
ncbi:hypothetical protein E2562_002547 [Oryza meyeriana var. granulata]|uniref:Uncharacterized protein n=1 Tax=Oryza meyeriana var. granulata TaxID=110450 RepID=A0A6G1F2R5_9ORYZ|nr:hypothetical protein E2562_002547 [Oryza meyeriana var. granulata]